MVGTGLLVQRRKDCVPLVLHNLAQTIQRPELPPHKGIIEGVPIGGDEGASPIDAAANHCQVLFGQGWEVAQPVIRRPELWDFTGWDITLRQDVPLSVGRPCLGSSLALLASKLCGVLDLLGRCLPCGSSGSHLSSCNLLCIWELGGHAILGQLGIQLVSTGLDGHAGAVESLGEQHALAAQTVVGSGELKLGNAESMTQVQHSVHVGVRKVTKEFPLRILLTRSRGVHLEHLLGFPLFLCRSLDLQQQVPPCMGCGPSLLLAISSRWSHG
mmetsp:Transcript_20342/g.56677  ORF Transcript_20342/g.56677 Transcript_20342/m.56677 type:complete len:271 (+) Transcript_20342:2879-3691(+)